MAEIPLWIWHTVKTPGIDLDNFPHFKAKTPQDLVQHFRENVEKAHSALREVSDGLLSGEFHLKANGQVVYTSTKKETIETTVNHMVHHRGQLTVYMRMNNILVPSIYGPSADEKGFKRV